jgi:hypothetical protein
MIAQALLDLVPQVLGHDRRVVSLVNLALMSDPADVDRVRQELIDVARLSTPPPVERPAPSMRITKRQPSNEHKRRPDLSRASRNLRE